MLSLSDETWSLWLRPAVPDERDSILQQLAENFGSPVFKCHVTLTGVRKQIDFLSLRTHVESVVEQWVSQRPHSLKRSNEVLVSLASRLMFSDSYFRAVTVPVDSFKWTYVPTDIQAVAHFAGTANSGTAEIGLLRSMIAERLGLQVGDYEPHVSLVYGNQNANHRYKVAADIAVQSMFLDTAFSCSGVSIVKSGLDLAQWEVTEEIQFDALS